MFVSCIQVVLQSIGLDFLNVHQGQCVIWIQTGHSLNKVLSQCSTHMTTQCHYPSNIWLRVSANRTLHLNTTCRLEEYAIMNTNVSVSTALTWGAKENPVEQLVLIIKNVNQVLVALLIASIHSRQFAILWNWMEVNAMKTMSVIWSQCVLSLQYKTST
jgi:hypothetical protein